MLNAEFRERCEGGGVTQLCSCRLISAEHLKLTICELDSYKVLMNNGPISEAAKLQFEP